MLVIENLQKYLETNWLSQGDREELRDIFEFVDTVVR